MNSLLATYAQTCFLLENNQNNLVSMVKENNIINRSYRTYPYLAFVFWTQIYVCLKYALFIFINVKQIFNGRILQPFMKRRRFSLGWNLKHETLLGILVYITYLCYIICVCRIRICRITDLAAKTTSFLYFCYTLLHDFWFLHDLELINLCLMFFDQSDLYLTFLFKTVTANTQIKAVFMHVN